MSVLGGRTRQTKTLRISGRVTFNGVEPSEFAVQRTVGLVSQQDLLIPNLTVQETVDFAAACLLPKSRRHWLSAEVAAAGAAVAKGKPADLEQDLEVQGMSDAEFAVAARCAA
jgi:ABC-type multidrug transport system ATPase subunit